MCCDRSHLAAEAKAFRRLRRKADTLATQIVRCRDEIMRSMPEVVADQTLIDFLAASLMEEDEQVFRWLLECPAAMKIQDIEDAKVNLHPVHPTAH